MEGREHLPPCVLVQASRGHHPGLHPGKGDDDLSWSTSITCLTDAPGDKAERRYSISRSSTVRLAMVSGLSRMVSVYSLCMWPVSSEGFEGASWIATAPPIAR